jgi:hypothetical protein
MKILFVREPKGSNRRLTAIKGQTHLVCGVKAHLLHYSSTRPKTEDRRYDPGYAAWPTGGAVSQGGQSGYISASGNFASVRK